MLNLADILRLNPSRLHFRNYLYASIPLQVAVLSQFKESSTRLEEKGDLGNGSDDLASH